MPNLISFRKELENTFPYYRKAGNAECFMHWKMNLQLSSTIKLLEKLYNLRAIPLKSTPLTDVELKQWDLVFEQFWFYKYLCLDGAGRKEYHFSTPINSDKLESAIMHMIDSYIYEYEVYCDTYKGIYNTHTLYKALSGYTRHGDCSFYHPFNHKNYVHLNKVH